MRPSFSIKEVDDRHTTSERLKKDLSGRLSLCEKDISITWEIEINRKDNRYAESIVEHFPQRFLNKLVTALNAFEIFNLRVFSN